MSTKILDSFYTKMLMIRMFMLSQMFHVKQFFRFRGYEVGCLLFEVK